MDNKKFLKELKNAWDEKVTDKVSDFYVTGDSQILLDLIQDELYELNSLLDFLYKLSEDYEGEEFVNRFTVKRILKSGDRTIVFWDDGEKTIVKKSEGEEDSPYDAFSAALAKRIYGSNSKIRKMLKKKTEYQVKT